MHPPMISFQSRYRAAFHFRSESLRRGSESHPRFNLVIERLFISGTRCEPSRVSSTSVSISLSSGFSFQEFGFAPADGGFLKVSISLSSGFSFQEMKSGWAARLSMFQSRY